MSMELWQRLKDLEKKVAEQGEEVKSIERRMGAKADVLVTPEGEVRIPVFPPAVSAPTKTMPWPTPEAGEIAGGERSVKPGPAICPKCGKVPGYYFHVKNCKGAA
jgi:hypothetical protein